MVSLQAGVPKFNLEGRSIRLVTSCAVFASLNLEAHGDASKALPDNLNILFRPVRLPAPDLQAIAHARLSSYGEADSQSAVLLPVQLTLHA